MARASMLGTIAGLFLGLAAVPAAGAGDPPTQVELLKSSNNLKLIGIGFHAFHDANGVLPNNIYTKDYKPLLSWRVAILPYVEQEELYKEFKLDEPWDSENNKKLIAKMPRVYAPVRVKAKPGETYYQVFTGDKTLFTAKAGGKEFPRRTRLVDVTDGTANTGMVFEAGEPVVWTKPADLPFDEAKPLPKLGGMFDGEFHVVLVDGSVIRCKKDADEKELKLLIMPADGIAPPDFKKLKP